MFSCHISSYSKQPFDRLSLPFFRRQATDEQEADLISHKSDEPQKQKDNFIFRIIKYRGKRKSVQFLDRFMERQKGKYAKLSNQCYDDSLIDIQLQHLDVNNLLNSPAFTKESNINYTAIAQNASRTSSSLDLEWEHEYASLRSFNPATLVTLECKEEERSLDVNNEKQHIVNTMREMLEASSLADLNTITYDSESVGQELRNDGTLNSRRLMRIYSAYKKAGSFSRTSSHASWSYNSTPESLEWDVDEEQQRQLCEEDDRLDHETLKLLHQIEQLKNQVLNETGEVFCENEGLVFKTNALDPLHNARSDILNMS